MNTEQTIDGIAVEWFRKMCVSQFHFSSPFFSPIYYSLFDFHKCEKKTCNAKRTPNYERSPGEVVKGQICRPNKYGRRTFMFMRSRRVPALLW